MMKIQIEGLNINGEGYCNSDNTKICVKNVLPNEIVEVEGVIKKNNFIGAKLINVDKPSYYRIKEKCKFCGNCGGCDFMFVDYDKGLEIKKQVIARYFNDLYSNDIIAHKSRREFFYRNKVSFFVENDKIGLLGLKSKNIVEIDKCIVSKEGINKALKITRVYLRTIKNKNIHHIVVRELDSGIIIVLVSEKKPKDVNLLLNLLKEEFGKNFGLYINYNLKNSKNILSDKFEFVYGQKYLKSVVNGIICFSKPYSFMQINDDVRNEMYERVKDEVNGEMVVEGYSGAGILSCIMAKVAKKVVSIEINKTATQDAEKTRKENNITNLENINGDCSKILPQIISKNKDAIFVIDPPRSGCSNNILEKLKENKIKKIIYISCNPYTLKQNLVYLKESFIIEKFEIFDIFPQTFEIESMVILKSK